MENDPLPSERQRQALGLAGPARHHLDALRNHEGRVEADAELADQPGCEAVLSILPFRIVLSVAALRLGHLLDEGLGAGARDGAEVVDQLLAVHADAVVGHHQHAVFAVGLDGYRERGIVAQQLGLRDRRVAQLVAGVRCVRDQLPQEYLLVAIERVGHEAEQFADLGLERVTLPVRFRHRSLRFARPRGRFGALYVTTLRGRFKPGRARFRGTGGSNCPRIGCQSGDVARNRPQSVEGPARKRYSSASSCSPSRTCSRMMPSDCSYRPSPSGVTNFAKLFGTNRYPRVVRAKMTEVVEEKCSSVFESSE